MPDDPTGRPKPTARRRRPSRSTVSRAVSGTQSTVDPAPLEPAAPTLEVAPEDVSADALDESFLADDSGATNWPALDGRSPNEWVCPFLRSVDERDRVDPPIEAPDVVNRCAAVDEPVAQSLRQQELVCLTTAHINCPRYLRGAVVATDVRSTRVRTTPMITPAMLGALALLAVAFAASVAFTFARGGLDLPAAAATGSPAPSSSAVAAVPTEAPSAAPSVGVSAAPSAAPTPAPTPASTAVPTPTPTSDRYALLTPCPGKSDCWIYRIRSGDNLFSIANYFGVPLATVKALNPWTATSGIKPGRELILPPPTR